jgi:hypothetical protein
VVDGEWSVALIRHVEGWVPYDETGDPSLLRDNFVELLTRQLEASLAELPFAAELAGLALNNGRFFTLRKSQEVTLEPIQTALSSFPGFQSVSPSAVLRVSG